MLHGVSRSLRGGGEKFHRLCLRLIFRPTPRFEYARLLYLEPIEGMFEQAESHPELGSTGEDFEDKLGSDSAAMDLRQFSILYF
jgi:hypothetical protein